jgi:hypothetical protein
MQDKLNMMRLKGDVEHEAFKKKMDSDFKAAQQAAANKKLAPQELQKAPVDKTKPKPKVGSLVAPQSGYPAAKKTELAPAESQRASSGGTLKVRPGHNPTKIAQELGMTLDQLEKKNPGILKRARRLKPGETVNR